MTKIPPPGAPLEADGLSRPAAAWASRPHLPSVVGAPDVDLTARERKSKLGLELLRQRWHGLSHIMLVHPGVVGGLARPDDALGHGIGRLFARMPEPELIGLLRERAGSRAPPEPFLKLVEQMRNVLLGVILANPLDLFVGPDSTSH